MPAILLVLLVVVLPGSSVHCVYLAVVGPGVVTVATVLTDHLVAGVPPPVNINIGIQLYVVFAVSVKSILILSSLNRRSGRRGSSVGTSCKEEEGLLRTIESTEPQLTAALNHFSPCPASLAHFAQYPLRTVRYCRAETLPGSQLSSFLGGDPLTLCVTALAEV